MLGILYWVTSVFIYKYKRNHIDIQASEISFMKNNMKIVVDFLKTSDGVRDSRSYIIDVDKNAFVLNGTQYEIRDFKLTPANLYLDTSIIKYAKILFEHHIVSGGISLQDNRHSFYYKYSNKPAFDRFDDRYLYFGNSGELNKATYNQSEIVTYKVDSKNIQDTIFMLKTKE